MSEWISVTDRLPDEGQMVLAYSKLYGGTYTVTSVGYGEQGDMRDKPRWFMQDRMFPFTHWMTWKWPDPPI